METIYDQYTQDNPRLKIDDSVLDILQNLLNTPIKSTNDIKCDELIDLVAISAVYHDDLKLLTTSIIDHKANIHKYANGLLLHATRLGNLDMFKFLLQHGYNLRMRHDACLRMACSYGHINIVEYILKKEPHIKSKKYKCFQNACAAGNMDIVKMLITHTNNTGALNAMLGRASCGPINRVCENGHMELLKFLIPYYHHSGIKKPFNKIYYSATNGGQLNIMKFIDSISTYEYKEHEISHLFTIVSKKSYIKILHYFLDNFPLPNIITACDMLKIAKYVNIAEIWKRIAYYNITTAELCDKKQYKQILNRSINSAISTASYNSRIDLLKFLIYQNHDTSHIRYTVFKNVKLIKFLAKLNLSMDEMPEGMQKNINRYRTILANKYMRTNTKLIPDIVNIICSYMVYH